MAMLSARSNHDHSFSKVSDEDIYFTTVYTPRQVLAGENASTRDGDRDGDGDDEKSAGMYAYPHTAHDPHESTNSPTSLLEEQDPVQRDAWDAAVHTHRRMRELLQAATQMEHDKSFQRDDSGVRGDDDAVCLPPHSPGHVMHIKRLLREESAHTHSVGNAKSAHDGSGSSSNSSGRAGLAPGGGKHSAVTDVRRRSNGNSGQITPRSASLRGDNGDDGRFSAGKSVNMRGDGGSDKTDRTATSEQSRSRKRGTNNSGKMDANGADGCVTRGDDCMVSSSSSSDSDSSSGSSPSNGRVLERDSDSRHVGGSNHGDGEHTVKAADGGTRGGQSGQSSAVVVHDRDESCQYQYPQGPEHGGDSESAHTSPAKARPDGVHGARKSGGESTVSRQSSGKSLSGKEGIVSPPRVASSNGGVLKTDSDSRHVVRARKNGSAPHDDDDGGGDDGSSSELQTPRNREKKGADGHRNGLSSADDSGDAPSRGHRGQTAVHRSGQASLSPFSEVRKTQNPNSDHRVHADDTNRARIDSLGRVDSPGSGKGGGGGTSGSESSRSSNGKSGSESRRPGARDIVNEYRGKVRESTDASLNGGRPLSARHISATEASLSNGRSLAARPVSARDICMHERNNSTSSGVVMSEPPSQNGSSLPVSVRPISARDIREYAMRGPRGGSGGVSDRRDSLDGEVRRGQIHDNGGKRGEENGHVDRRRDRFTSVGASPRDLAADGYNNGKGSVGVSPRVQTREGHEGLRERQVRSVCVCTCTCMCIYLCMYVNTHIERKRERHTNTYTYMHMLTGPHA
jgi:hypothetical protein